MPRYKADLESHPNKPGIGVHDCQCGAPAMPCFKCMPDNDWYHPPDFSQAFTSVLREAGKKVH